MPLKSHELDKIATVTLAHYEQHAEEFRAGTRDHDVSQNIASLLGHIEGESRFTILDFGCGPGRDLKTFSGLGHTAIGPEDAVLALLEPPVLYATAGLSATAAATSRSSTAAALKALLAAVTRRLKKRTPGSCISPRLHRCAAPRPGAGARDYG
jgi:hypothetical protein